MNGCDRFEDALVELALGTVAGEDRAAVLDHIARCPACEARLAEHVRVVDRFLALGPEAQPPAGFEGRALEAFQPARRSRRGRWRAVGLVAAAAAVAGLLATGATLRLTEDDRAAGRHHRADLARAGGSYFGTRTLTPATPGASGTAFAYEGDPSWLVVTAHIDAAVVEVVVEGTDGTVRGAAQKVGDDWSWGGALPFALRDVRAVRVLADGTTALALVLR